MLRIANLVMIVLFVSWAYFQWNDPDPLLWMAIYGTAALACTLFAFGRLPEIAAAAFSACCVLGALYLAGRVVLERQFIFDEMGREMMGLLIVAAWTGLLAWQVRHREADRHAGAPAS